MTTFEYQVIGTNQRQPSGEFTTRYKVKSLFIDDQEPLTTSSVFLLQQVSISGSDFNELMNELGSIQEAFDKPTLIFNDGQLKIEPPLNQRKGDFGISQRNRPAATLQLQN